MTASNSNFYDKRLDRYDGWMALKETWETRDPGNPYIQQLTSKINRLRVTLGIIS